MGLAYSFLREAFPPSPRFAADAIPDLSGKVVLVTGANAGIGKETARVLLTKNAKVWIACRNVSRGEATLKELKELTGQDAHLLILDLSNLRSIKQSAQEFLRRECQLDLLFNNAGVFDPPIDMVTCDGYDLQFGTNVLGHFFFTKLLLPILIATAKSSPEGIVRVVNTSSQAHWFGQLDFGTFKDCPKRRADWSFRLYGQSKAGNIVFSTELHRRHYDQGIVSTVVHPGYIRTEAVCHHGWLFQRAVGLVVCDVSYGALTQLYAGTAPDAANLDRQYLAPWGHVGTPCANTQDPLLGKELWVWLEDQVKDLEITKLE